MRWLGGWAGSDRDDGDDNVNVNSTFAGFDWPTDANDGLSLVQIKRNQERISEIQDGRKSKKISLTHTRAHAYVVIIM